MVVFAKVKYLTTLADTFYFFWLHVMRNYLVYVRENRSFAGSSYLQLLRLQCNNNNQFVYCISFIHYQRISEDFSRLKKIECHEGVHWTSSSNVLLAQPVLLPRGGRGGKLLGILGGGVPPGSSNPDPISNQKCHFSHRFSDMASKIHTHSQTSL